MNIIELVFGILLLSIFIFIFISIAYVDEYKAKVRNLIEKIRYKSNKSSEIYGYTFFNGGFHLTSPENTFEAYERAIQLKKNVGIKIDIQFSKDDIPFCFSYRYMSESLGLPGRIRNRYSYEIEKCKLYNTKNKVTRLLAALKVIDNRVPIIVKFKGKITSRQLYIIEKIFTKYKCQFYVFASNFKLYNELNRIPIFKGKVFYSKNIFRKKITIENIKPYKKLSNIDHEKVSKIFDIAVSIEESNGFKDVIKKAWYIVNQYESRIKEDDPLMRMLIAHRALVNKMFKEHSIESIIDCVKRNCMAEIDVTWYKGRPVCYHSDKLSGKVIKQQSSCACEKLPIDEAVSFRNMLEAVNNEESYLILDIKDGHPRDRKLEKAMIQVIEEIEFKGKIYVQSFNPFVIRWFYKNYPDYKRGIVCNSLSKVIKTQWPRITINAFLSSYGKPDYIVYDFGNLFWIFSKLNATIGLPVIVYPPKSESELTKYIGFFVNFIGENYINRKDWRHSIDYHKDGTLSRKQKIPQPK